MINSLLFTSLGIEKIFTKIYKDNICTFIMHETAIAHNVIEEAKKHGNVKELYVEIGELSPVPTHELVECLKRLVDWKVVHKEKPAVVECSCGYTGHPKILERGHDSFMIECPKCKEVPDLIDGFEIIISKVVVE